jgi:manganese/zinc/iron transport system substrate-binding protein
MRRLLTFFVLVGLSVLLFGCSKTDSPTATGPSEAKLKVTTTVGMITDLVKRIGGDQVEVTGLMGPGTDPHLYKARERDIRMLAGADIIFYNGLHLEGKLGDVLEKVARKKSVIAVAEAIDESLLRTPPEFEGAHDPHVWFDVSLWTIVAEKIREELGKAAPKHKALFDANHQALSAELLQLHQWCKDQIATIPKERRVLITAHDAFGYFGRAYDIEVGGIQGISTEDEAGVGEINQLIDYIAGRGIKAVFVESSVPRKNIEALIEGATAKGAALKVGGELFSDAMGAADSPDGTYPGMVRHNVNTIVSALK